MRLGTRLARRASAGVSRCIGHGGTLGLVVLLALASVLVFSGQADAEHIQTSTDQSANLQAHWHEGGNQLWVNAQFNVNQEGEGGGGVDVTLQDGEGNTCQGGAALTGGDFDSDYATFAALNVQVELSVVEGTCVFGGPQTLTVTWDNMVAQSTTRSNTHGRGFHCRGRGTGGSASVSGGIVGFDFGGEASVDAGYDFFTNTCRQRLHQGGGGH